MRRRKKNFVSLKIKRAAFFCFALSFFLLPGQNWYSAVALNYRSSQVQSVNITPPPLTDYPVFIGPQTPQVTARAAVVLDRDSAVLMYGKNETTPLLPASTVKIMTALVVLDQWRLDEVLLVSAVNNREQDMNLQEGEKITVGNLLYGLLVASANDAALVLAQDYPGGETAFVAAMNRKAKDLNLNDTHFANPTGLDSDEKGKLLADYSYTTALDLSRLAAAALKNQTIDEVVATPKITVTDVAGKITHDLYSTNALLGKVEGLKGLKTGWTEEAGESLVGYAEREGRGVISVVLGSQDRFGETAKLINWAFSNHRWEVMVPSI